MLKPGDRCRIWKAGAHWIVMHIPSHQILWAGYEWVDAIGFATGRKQ